MLSSKLLRKGLWLIKEKAPEHKHPFNAQLTAAVHSKVEGLARGDSAGGWGFIASDTYFQIWDAAKVLIGRLCMKTCRQWGLSLCLVGLGWGTRATVPPSCCWGKGQLCLAKIHLELVGLVLPSRAELPLMVQLGSGTQQRIEFLRCQR